MPNFDDGKNDRPYWLLTGVTGLVGQYLLKDLLIAGFPVAVLVRPNKKESATQRMESIMQRWESTLNIQLPRPVILEGDVKTPGLGLSQEQSLWVRRRVGRFIHNAAILKFFGPCHTGEPWQTNVVGTQNVLDFVRAAGIDQFHYVSTAYVAGRQEAVVHEDDYPEHPVFRNDYEHSKWVAEGLVRSAQFAHPPTIYRPVVIAGDSNTGYTSTYHGLYLYLRTMALLVPQQQRDEQGKLLTKIRLPMSGLEERNIVPVQWVSQVITHLLETPAAHGKTFHLAPKHGITPNELIQSCYRYFGSTGVEFCPELEGQRPAENDFASKVFDSIQIYRDYDTSDPHFDTSNLEKYAGHLDCPILDQTVIARYLEFGERDRWGKAKSPPPDLSLDGRELVERLAEEIGDLLPQLAGLDSASESPNNSQPNGEQRVRPQTVCFQLLGPGGGPFTVSVSATGQTHVQTGIVAQPTVLLQLSARSLQKWLASDYTQRRKTTALWLERQVGTMKNQPS
ncbi:MAG: SDR family oxidoreductase [Planctomycetaceae bacterium]|nr:SDR family oxidoreductase [Planctomycetaceae bacterium]